MSRHWTIITWAILAAVGSLPVKANHAPIEFGHTVSGHAIPASGTSVQVLHENLTITIEKPTYGVPIARVTADYTLKNPTDRHEHLSLGFPVSGPKYLPDLPVSRPTTTQPDSWFSVWSDGQPLSVLQEIIPENIETPEEQWNRKKRYHRLLNDWMAREPVLSGAFTRYSQLAVTQTEISDAAKRFEMEVKKHLLDPSLSYAALEFAKNEDGYLYQLIPEVNPTWRADIPYNGKKYISLIPDQTNKYRLLENQWRQQIVAWLQSQPALWEAAEEVRDIHKRFTISQDFWKQHLGPGLRDTYHLTEKEIVHLLWYQSWKHSLEPLLSRPQGLPENLDWPPLDVMNRLFPEVRDEFERIDAAKTELHEAWGIDKRFVSVFTGRLYQPAERLARDDAVLSHLMAPASQPATAPSDPDFSAWANQRQLLSRIMKYEIDLAPGAQSTLTVRYSTLTELDESLYLTRSYAIVPQFTYILNTVRYWNHFGPISIRIVMPESYRAVILPVPEKSSVTQDKMIYEITLQDPKENLYMALLSGPEKNSLNWPITLIQPNDESLTCLQNLLAKTTHPAVKNFLRAAIAYVYIQSDKKIRAWELTQDLHAEDPDFNWLSLMFGNQGNIDRVKAISDWIEAKAKSPTLVIGDGWFNLEDFRFFYRHDDHLLSHDDLLLLTQKMASYLPTYESIEEQMGEHFIFCAAQIEPEKHLKKFLELARANPELTCQTLRMLQYWPVNKDVSLPYVLDLLDPYSKPDHQAGTIQTEAIQSLRTFTVGDFFPELLAMMYRTDNSWILENCMEALNQGKSTICFSDLIALESKFSKSGRYHSLLAKVDPQQAVIYFHEIMKSHPEQILSLMRTLAELGDKSIIPKAMAFYATSHDENIIGTTARSLEQVGSPLIFDELPYRGGQPEWVNQPLLTMIREKGGGDSAFEFVESFFLEHAKSKEMSTCIRAFEKLGDPRAIPYLREILKTTERQWEVAQTLGTLLIIEKIKMSSTRPAQAAMH